MGVAKGIELELELNYGEGRQNCIAVREDKTFRQYFVCEK